ncbi:DUF2345 domain-containing protein [Thorsellia kenyensis]|uniref:DUF2345 domain-containing protein n=1 Tax=Thorsellia kenyensis TaxID=1549888 RepID=A0ABV6CAF3_9GAMM
MNDMCLSDAYAESLSTIGEKSELSKLEVEKQSAFLENNIIDLAQPIILAGGVNGIALSTPNHIQQSANGNLIATAGGSSELSVLGKIALMAKKAVTIFAHEMGMKLVAAAGKMQIQAQSDAMEITAVKGITITSTEDEILITAKKKITLMCGGSYVTFEEGKIEHGTDGNFHIKSAKVIKDGPSSQNLPMPGFTLCEQLSASSANSGSASMPLR